MKTQDFLEIFVRIYEVDVVDPAREIEFAKPQPLTPRPCFHFGCGPVANVQLCPHRRCEEAFS